MIDTNSPGRTSRSMRRSTKNLPAPWSNDFSMPRSRTSGSRGSRRSWSGAEVGEVDKTCLLRSAALAAQPFQVLLRVVELRVHVDRLVELADRLRLLPL